MEITTSVIRYSTPVSVEELVYLRPALIGVMGREETPLAHNHVGSEGYRYAYPLIQYKRLRGCAAAVFIGRGVESAGKLVSLPRVVVNLGKRRVGLEVSSYDVCKTKVGVTSGLAYLYDVTCWAPFNEGNVVRFRKLKTDLEKRDFLESILVGNILSMFKGIGLVVNERIVVRITELSQFYERRYKDVRMQVVDIQFISNTSLPEYVGLGKNASVGFGVLTSAERTPEV